MDHFKLKKIREELKQKNEENYKNSSKGRLLNNIRTKFRTTMVGALAAFEDMFPDVIDANPKEWDEVRTRILDLGHKQLRAAEQEISEYTISWNRYKAEFRITQQE